MNECGACGLDFGSVKAFDAHRIGVHAYTHAEGLRRDPPRENGRRCLTRDEMRRSPDFALNALGRWSLARDVAKGRELRRRISVGEVTRVQPPTV